MLSKKEEEYPCSIYLRAGDRVMLEDDRFMCNSLIVKGVIYTVGVTIPGDSNQLVSLVEVNHSLYTGVRFRRTDIELLGTIDF